MMMVLVALLATSVQLPDHRPEHRSPLSGRVAFNVDPGLRHLG
jgi:hypothetical protein